MPYFKISKAKGGLALGTVEAEDSADAFDVFAMKSGFWDFRDLAQSMEMSEDKARHGLDVREIDYLPVDVSVHVPEYVVS